MDPNTPTKNSFGNKDNRSNFQRYKVEIAVACSAALCMFNTGVHLGWAGPAIGILISEEKSPDFYITLKESSWLSSFVSIGCITGGLLGYLLAKYWSRNKAILLTSIPFLIGSIIFAFCRSLYPYYFGRFLVGTAMGTSFGVAPMYASEIASVEIRGAIGTIISIGLGLGVFISYLLIPILSLTNSNILFIGFAGLQFVLCLFIPESPHLLLLKKRETDAKNVLIKLRGTNNVNGEFKATSEYVNEQLQENVTLGIILTDSVKRHAMLLSCLTMVAQQLSGTGALLAFSQVIFESSTEFLSSDACGVIYGFFQLVPIFTTGYVIEKFGRKILLVLSSGLCAIPLIILGIYFYFLETSDFNSWTFVPLATMLVQIFLYSIGIGSLPYLYMSEMVTSNIRPLGSCVLVLVSSAINFAAIMLFNILDRGFGKCFAFWLFAVLTLTCSVLMAVFLIETKGKTFAEIQLRLAHKKYSGRNL